MAATQNTVSESVFVWDLNGNRPVKSPEDKSPDQPEIALNFRKDEVVLRAFSWVRNSCTLHSVVHLDGKKETLLVRTNLGVIERKFCAAEEKADVHRQSGSDTDRSTINVNPNKPDKGMEVTKLPVNVSSFFIHESDAHSVFCVSQEQDLLVDSRDPNGALQMGDVQESSGPFKAQGLVYIDFNGNNTALFARAGRTSLFDIRKVC